VLVGRRTRGLSDAFDGDIVRVVIWQSSQMLRKCKEGESESEVEGGDDNERRYKEEQSP